MMTQNTKKDILILVADKDMEMAIKGVFERPEAIGIRRITYDIFSHPRHDPGCCLGSHVFLRSFSSSYQHAVVIFDREGSGKENKSREKLEAEIEKQLEINGWNDGRAKVITLEPELESWVWSGSPHVRDVIGWKNGPNRPRLREWLSSQGFLDKDKKTISRPKEALEAVRKYTKKPKSPALFYQLAQWVSLKNCSDPSFEKLKSTLQIWFPE
jgi:hypothetical protein